MTVVRRKTPIGESEVEITAVRSQGAGGQNVNKVSSAIHLRYDVHASSLSEAHKARLLGLSDSRLTADGVVIIKSQEHRSQEMNRAGAWARLQELVDSVAVAPRVRKATKPTKSSQRRRLDGKAIRGQVKALRGKVGES